MERNESIIRNFSHNYTLLIHILLVQSDQYMYKPLIKLYKCLPIKAAGIKLFDYIAQMLTINMVF